MTVPKRQTLADFLSYDLCTGQRLAGPYGYSPLPLNLVKAAFGQLEKLGPNAEGGAVSGVHIKNPSANLAQCNNPTFVKGNLAANHLAQIAPMPLACQKATSQPCGDGTVPPGTNGNDPNGQNGTNPNGTTPSGTNPNGTTPSGTNPTGTNSGGPSGNTGPTSSDGTTAPGGNTPTTGDGTTPVNGTTNSDGTTTEAATTPAATEIPANRSTDNAVWGWTAVLELLAIVLLPGLYVAWLRRHRSAR